jgi:hypothetical protein
MQLPLFTAFPSSLVRAPIQPLPSHSLPLQALRPPQSPLLRRPGLTAREPLEMGVSAGRGAIYLRLSCDQPTRLRWGNHLPGSGHVLGDGPARAQPRPSLRQRLRRPVRLPRDAEHPDHKHADGTQRPAHLGQSVGPVALGFLLLPLLGMKAAAGGCGRCRVCPTLYLRFPNEGLHLCADGAAFRRRCNPNACRLRRSAAYALRRQRSRIDDPACASSHSRGASAPGRCGGVPDAQLGREADTGGSGLFVLMAFDELQE